MQKKEYENQFQINLEHQGSPLHKEEGDDQSRTLWWSSECRRKNMKIKSRSIKNTKVVTYTNKRVMIKSNSIQNAKEVTFKQKRMRMKSISKQKTMMTTCTQKKVKIKSNSIQKTKEVT